MPSDGWEEVAADISATQETPAEEFEAAGEAGNVEQSAPSTVDPVAEGSQSWADLSEVFDSTAWQPVTAQPRKDAMARNLAMCQSLPDHNRRHEEKAHLDRVLPPIQFQPLGDFPNQPIVCKIQCKPSVATKHRNC